MNPATHGSEGSTSALVLYMALELSNKTWRLALSDGAERRQVVDAASIEVRRRLRHVKTDRLDAERLLAKLIGHHTGERGDWNVVRVPSIEEEDARHLRRELERLKHERLAHRLRIQSLLVTQGVRLSVKSALRLRLDSLTLWDAHPLPVERKAQLEREAQRLALVERQIEELEAQRRERLSSPRTEAERKIVHPMRLGAIGPGSAWLWLRYLEDVVIPEGARLIPATV